MEADRRFKSGGKSGIFVILAILVFVPAGVGYCRTITVDANGSGDYPTIQAAIDDANDGDEVVLEPGTYTGEGNRDIDFLGKAITVRSTDLNDPDIVDSTVIDCNGSPTQQYRGFLFRNSEGPNSVIAGVTIVNGYSKELTIGGVDLPWGDAIFSYEASPTIKNCVISQSLYGGAVLFYYGSPSFTNCTVTDNPSNVFQIFCRGCTNPTISNCTISNNAGGAILDWGSTDPTFTDCTVTGNASSMGAAVYYYESSPTITNCTISDNNCGGIQCQYNSSPIITNCIITGNSGGEGAGILCDDYSNPVITGCTISGNSSDWRGGGILCGGSGSITNCIVSDNSAESQGGGIYCGSGDSITINNCIIQGNSTDEEGGGIYADRRVRRLYVTDCKINNNRASRLGGGIGAEARIQTIANCTIAGNSSEGGRGGGIYCRSGEGKITNCVIVNNNVGLYGAPGGGIYCEGGDPIITNCTISGNTAGYEGGGGIALDDADATITNCILWDNAPDEIWREGGSLQLSFCDIQGGSPRPGPGNIDVNPGFAFGTDFHLASDSPCIDAGDPNYAPEPNEMDLDGNPRKLDGDSDANAIVDMGAYEYNPDSPSIAATSTTFYYVQDGPNPDPQSISVRNCGGGILNWQITEDCDWLEAWPTNGVSNGQINEITLTVEPTSVPIGSYACSLEITDPNATNSPLTVDILLHVGEIFAVPEDFNTIQAAIDAANDYDMVLVADGNYTGDGNRNLKFNGKAITVKSENGPNNCIIDCQSEAFGFRFHDGEKADSILDGFSITNGSDYNGSAIHCWNSSPTIKKCFITSNCAQYRGGAIYCESSNPTISNCTITGNWVEYHHGGAIFIIDSSPLIADCTISDNSAPRDGGALYCTDRGKPVIINCTITGNSAKSAGAIYCVVDYPAPIALALINCTITGNSAQTSAGAIGLHGHPDYPATLAMANCTISGNLAEASGGALYCGEFTGSVIASSTMTDNSTNAQGAGIYCASDANVVIAGSTIAACTAGGDGGGIYCAEDSNVGVIHCTIVDNTAADNGGGIYFGQAAPFVANSTITGNTAVNQGGGIYAAAGIIIDNSLVAGNVSDTGGGVYSHDGMNLIENCTFAANKALDAGGGLYCYFPSGSSWPYYDVPPEFEGLPWGSLIPAPPIGPGAYSNISNSIFWDNVDQAGRQIAAESAYTPAPPTWPPIFVPDPPVWYPDWPDWMDRFRDPKGLPEKQTSLIVTDWPSRTRPSLPEWPEWPFPLPPDFPWPPNLPWPPTPPEFPPIPTPPQQPPHPRVIKIEYSDIAGGQDNVYTDSQWNLIWGAGNADTDPCFVDPGCWADVNDPCVIVEPNEPNAVWVDGDYHLLAGSSCIDAGEPNYAAGPNETDLDGKPRVLDGDEDGIAMVDMGSYEFVPNTEPFACIVSGDRVVEADSNCEGRVVLDGSCSSDVDSTEGTNDDINDFDWYEVIDACDPNSDIYIGSGEVIECNLGLGEHLIVLEVTDKAGAVDSNEVVITVEDVTPPELNVVVEPNILWPPNGKVVLVRPEWEVSDNCDEEVEVSLVDISMNVEGDINDYVEIGDDGSIYLRASKSKRGSGRIYTLTYQALDDAGNTAQASSMVTVPHSRKVWRLGRGLVRRPGKQVYRRGVKRREATK